MLNQPVSHAFDGVASQAGEAGTAWRFRIMVVAFLLALLVVTARIGWVQSRLPGRYLAALSITTTEYELIPARDGRILANTMVLAEDEDRYSVEVHYRWLERPPGDHWLGKYVRSELTAEERRDKTRVVEMRSFRIRQQHALWENLQLETSVSPQRLAERRSGIQQRVKRIADDVNRRHIEKLRRESSDPDAADPEALPPDNNTGILMQIASAVRRAVTTPPRRQVTERIVVREEEGYHVVIPDVPLRIAAEIRAHPERFPGTRVTVSTRRTYNQASTCSHVVGARTPLRDDEQQLDDGIVQRVAANWRPRRGRSGVEYSWDHRLRGTPGLRKTVRNRRQQIVTSEVVRIPAAGRDVGLTIDVELQQQAELLLEEALGDRPRSLLPAPNEEEASSRHLPTGGCVMIMEARNGRVLAAASAPGFDLSLFTSGTSTEWEAARGDRRQPFLSRMTAMVVPPGSVFKPLTAVAALEHLQLDPDQSIYCPGYLDHPDEHRCLVYRLHGTGHGATNLQRALARSCNVYFFGTARSMGIRPLHDWATRFGFGERTGIDLPFEQPGNVPGRPSPDQESRHVGREALGMAIGQSRLTVTPLQIVRMMAAIANGGRLVVPHVVSPDGVPRTTDEIDDAPRSLSALQIPGLHGKTLRVIREGLEAAVQQPWGTGYRTVRLDSVLIAGKSGTAETGLGKPDHAWFAGYVPADRPKHAFVVVLEHGGAGSQTAGPIAREIVQFMVDHNLF